jgi:hypothetical protein
MMGTKSSDRACDPARDGGITSSLKSQIAISNDAARLVLQTRGVPLMLDFEMAAKVGEGKDAICDRNGRCDFNCTLGQIVLFGSHIRPSRVGSLSYPERYRNLGAFLLPSVREVRT